MTRGAMTERSRQMLHWQDTLTGVASHHSTGRDTLREGAYAGSLQQLRAYQSHGYRPMEGNHESIAASKSDGPEPTRHPASVRQPRRCLRALGIGARAFRERVL